MLYEIDIVNPNHIAQMWPVFEPMLKRAMEHAKGEITLEQMKVNLVNGSLQLMVYLEDKKIIGSVAIEWINYPNDRVMHISAIGGRTEPECVEQMYQWAKLKGATTVRGSAHKSVARLWKMKYGFETIYYVVEKRL